MTKTLVIICSKQFGYLSDYYYYCKYLSGYQIIFVCRDQKLKKIDTFENVQVHYISGPFFLPKVIVFIHRLGTKRSDFLYFVYYQRLCFLYTCLIRKATKILDIRTGDITKNSIRRLLYNFLLRIESLFFNYSFIISDSLRKYLKIRLKNTKIVPLGAVEIGFQNRTLDELHLLYVGTFFNRNIHLTIKGLAKFKRIFPEVPIKYTIIGFGPESDTRLIENEIFKHGFGSDVVRLIGRLHHSDLKEYFMKSNVGISFIPITDYFHCQPPTKTFEYICSGMVCLATATEENIKVISAHNGVLINDDPDSFAAGLSKIWENRNNYDCNKIRINSSQYHWGNIVKDYLEPALESIQCLKPDTY